DGRTRMGRPSLAARFTFTVWMISGCSAGHAPPARAPVATTMTVPAASPPDRPSGAFRLALCTEAPVRLQGPPGAQQSRGCVVTFTQDLSDPATIHSAGAGHGTRR